MDKISSKTVWLECQSLLVPQVGRSENQLLAGLVPSQSLLLGLQMATFSGCLHVVFSTYACALISSPSADTSHVELGRSNSSS